MKYTWFKTLSRSFVIKYERYLAKKVIFSLTPGERVLVGILLLLFVLGGLLLLGQVSRAFLIQVPAPGGSVSEGIIGSPRFINPLLATSDADIDLSLLIYSGLMKATPAGGLVPDLAESYTISPDELIYSFNIRKDIYFHDGTQLTANDVRFTVERAQDSLLKSPKRASWDGVSVEVINDHEIIFRLSQPYAPFLENTTMGILPENIWGSIDVDQFPFSQKNIEPIGSGPFKVVGLERNSVGVPDKYVLKAFSGYSLGRPYISKLIIRFYTNEAELLSAYRRREIEAASSISPHSLNSIKAKRIENIPLPRIFAVFFNQNRAGIFTRKEVREALNLALDKEIIVEEVLASYGSPLESPLPPGILPDSEEEQENTASTTERIIKILERGDWEKNENGIWEHSDEGPLAFSLATSNTVELKAAAELIEESWEKIGADVNLQIFEPGILNQNVIRPREYDALLFGEIIGRELDLFAFWHSSQRNDPGLNIALYANITTDKLLEDARTTLDRDERIKLFTEFEEEIQKDTPAVFVYAPDFIYVVPKRIKGLELGTVVVPGERFLNVHEWFIETNYVWSIFTK